MVAFFYGTTLLSTLKVKGIIVLPVFSRFAVQPDN